MRVLNVHHRDLHGSPGDVGALIDSLSSQQDSLWPKERWPAMRFDRPLGEGAVGGHGPVRYIIERYEPGRLVLFRFTGPSGFDGTHGFTLEEIEGGRTRLTHTLEMVARRSALITWPLVFRPLHDALIEDSLDKAERSLGQREQTASWSGYVSGLRWVIGIISARRRTA